MESLRYMIYYENDKLSCVVFSYIIFGNPKWPPSRLPIPESVY